MEDKPFILHVDDSGFKRQVVAEAISAACPSAELIQYDNPFDAFKAIREHNRRILAVITDNQMLGQSWAIKIVTAALREGIANILIYSSAEPNEPPPEGVDFISSSEHEGRTEIVERWLHGKVDAALAA